MVEGRPQACGKGLGFAGGWATELRLESETTQMLAIAYLAITSHVSVSTSFIIVIFLL